MVRIVAGLSATITHTFYSDGIATNPSPDTATIGITRADGTILVAAGTATTDTGTGTVSYTLTPTQTALLDMLVVNWTATFGSQPQVFTDYVEVAGGTLFNVAEARALTPLNDSATYTLAKILTVRTLVEEAIEDTCGVAFVPRYKRETISGTNTSTIVLNESRVTALRSITRDGVALSVGDLATVVANEAGVLYYPSGWAWGASNYVIAYEHGYVRPPSRIKQAALTLARSWLVDGPLDDRTTAFTTPDGTFALSTPGMRGSIFGIPEVDAAVRQYDERAMVA